MQTFEDFHSQRRTRNMTCYIIIAGEYLEQVNVYKYLRFWLDSTNFIFI